MIKVQYRRFLVFNELYYAVLFKIVDSSGHLILEVHTESNSLRSMFKITKAVMITDDVFEYQPEQIAMVGNTPYANSCVRIMEQFYTVVD